MKMPRVIKTFSMEAARVKEFEAAAKQESKGNQSLFINRLFDFWQENKRKKKRQFFREIDALVAQTIAEAQGEKKPTKKQILSDLEELQRYGESLSKKKVTEADAVRAVKQIRKERENAFTSRH